MKHLTVLATPVNGVGHVNACAGALSSLLPRGHRVIFVIEEAFEGKLKALGFEEHVYRTEKPAQAPTKNPGEAAAQMFIQNKVIGDYSPLEKVENMSRVLHSSYKMMELVNGVIKEAIEAYKPDAIYHSGPFLLPAVYFSGIALIKTVSTVPLCFAIGDNVVPGSFGLPYDSDPTQYDAHRKVLQSFFYSSKYNDFIESIGYSRYPNDSMSPESEILTVYGYPNELDYPNVREQGWFNLEVFNKETPDKNDKLENYVSNDFLQDDLDGTFSGKLILVSLGSMGSIDLELMKRLVLILSKTNHKYIVSKGPRHSEYDLARNMWGERYLPQTKIVPFMDLVITHGGNNTVTEVFAMGKPMIVLPLFGDQNDNAQRLSEKGFGLGLETYRFKDEQLVDAVEQLLNDDKLKEKFKIVSQRIQSSNRHEKLAIKIEQLLTK